MCVSRRSQKSSPRGWHCTAVRGASCLKRVSVNGAKAKGTVQRGNGNAARLGDVFALHGKHRGVGQSRRSAVVTAYGLCGFRCIAGGRRRRFRRSRRCRQVRRHGDSQRKAGAKRDKRAVVRHHGRVLRRRGARRAAQTFFFARAPPPRSNGERERVGKESARARNDCF